VFSQISAYNTIYADIFKLIYNKIITLSVYSLSIRLINGDCMYLDSDEDEVQDGEEEEEDVDEDEDKDEVPEQG